MSKKWTFAVILLYLGVTLCCGIVPHGSAINESKLNRNDSFPAGVTGNGFIVNSCPVENITEFLPETEFDGLTGGACYFPVSSPDEAARGPVDYTSICNERFCNERMERMMECHYMENWDWKYPESQLNRLLYFSIYQFRDADVASRVLPDTQLRLNPMFYPPLNTTELVVHGTNITSYNGVHDYCSGNARCRRGQHIPLYTEVVVWQQGKYIFHIIYSTTALGSNPHATILKFIDHVQNACSPEELMTDGLAPFFDRKRDGALAGLTALPIRDAGFLSSFRLKVPV